MSGKERINQGLPYMRNYRADAEKLGAIFQKDTAIFASLP